jgi:hypothetical protein
MEVVKGWRGQVYDCSADYLKSLLAHRVEETKVKSPGKL